MQKLMDDGYKGKPHAVIAKALGCVPAPKANKKMLDALIVRLTVYGDIVQNETEESLEEILKLTGNDMNPNPNPNPKPKPNPNPNPNPNPLTQPQHTTRTQPARNPHATRTQLQHGGGVAAIASRKGQPEHAWMGLQAPVHAVAAPC